MQLKLYHNYFSLKIKTIKLKKQQRYLVATYKEITCCEYI